MARAVNPSEIAVKLGMNRARCCRWDDRVGASTGPVSTVTPSKERFWIIRA